MTYLININALEVERSLMAVYDRIAACSDEEELKELHKDRDLYRATLQKMIDAAVKIPRKRKGRELEALDT